MVGARQTGREEQDVSRPTEKQALAIAKRAGWVLDERGHWKVRENCLTYEIRIDDIRRLIEEAKR
jgi:hypothetical protein